MSTPRAASGVTPEGAALAARQSRFRGALGIDYHSPSPGLRYEQPGKCSTVLSVTHSAPEGTRLHGLASLIRDIQS